MRKIIGWNTILFVNSNSVFLGEFICTITRVTRDNNNPAHELNYRKDPSDGINSKDPVN